MVGHVSFWARLCDTKAGFSLGFFLINEWPRNKVYTNIGKSGNYHIETLQVRGNIETSLA